MKAPPSHSQIEESNYRSTSVIFSLLHYTIDRKGIYGVVILLNTYVFDSIVLSVKFGLTSHEDLPKPLCGVLCT